MIAGGKKYGIVGNGKNGAVLIMAGMKEGADDSMSALFIKCRRRLIEEQEGLGHRKGCSQEEALSLPARELRGREVKERGLEAQGGKEGDRW